jgi:hypothetical protein
MWGSYGSYSSMSASSPIDITPSSMREQDASCAFPSWPRRFSLSDDEQERPRASSFLSDDELFLSDPFDDDTRSISSNGTAVSSPSECSPAQQVVSDAQLLAEIERERAAAMQREFVRQIISEKERRRQAASSKKRRSSPGGKKSPKSKLSSMTPIAEASE